MPTGTGYATNSKGGSPRMTLEDLTDNVYIPDVPDIDQAMGPCMDDEVLTAAAAELCVREVMHTYSVTVAVVRLCEAQSGMVVACAPITLSVPISAPQQPDEDDPSVPPTRNPDGSPADPTAPSGGAGVDLGIRYR